MRISWPNRPSDVQAARDAQSAGQTERFKKLAAALAQRQKEVHLQAFATAPIDEVLDEIKDRLPEIKRQAAVSVLISKWDEPALRQHPNAAQVDLTDTLAGLFNPSEKQWKVIAEIKRQKPVPADQITE